MCDGETACGGGIAGLMLAGGAAEGQSGNATRPKSALARPAGTIPAEAGAALAALAAQAAVIFRGEVVAITRADSLGFVDVRFHVDEAVRGCSPAGFYTLREWAGLWRAHPNRFREGQHLLMLLTARNDAGLSSPVGGMDGAIPLVAIAPAPVAVSGVAPADAATASAWAVDLRWIATRVERPAQVTAGKTSLAQARSAGENDWAGPIAPLTPATTSTAGWNAVLAAMGGTGAGVGYAR